MSLASGSQTKQKVRQCCSFSSRLLSICMVQVQQLCSCVSPTGRCTADVVWVCREAAMAALRRDLADGCVGISDVCSALAALTKVH
jgi:hypothetical protein